MPIRRRFPAAAVADSDDLETRLAALESAPAESDLDARSWLWMVLLGIVLPIGLIIAGWYA
jgi:hypothetical protein